MDKKLGIMFKYERRMNVRYKLGDKVVLRDDLTVKKDDADHYVKDMEYLKGKPHRILEIYGESYNIDGWYVGHEMIDHEKTAQLHYMEKEISNPHYQDLLNDSNIQPKHYNKGEIDLYESAYQTRPFNEYRAIMEFIAERYIKRDKTNRVEDIEKAIYTLERLKEKEERHERNEI